ncbi:MORN repeat-containing protein [Trypanosoma cruzi]|nr:MORN repeat-containing protein [Trypanosoma cruzi]
MSLPARVTQSQPADVTFESHQSGIQRVMMCPIEFGTCTGIQTEQLGKNAGIGLKQQNVCLRHLYTGEVVRADRNHNCGNSNNVFIPHGVGKLACFFYAKGGTVGFAGKPGSPVGLPHTVVISEYGEVEELRDAVLLTFSMYTGSFSYGRRQGKGRLTVYPHYFIDCLWDNDAPLLDRTPCDLCFFSKDSMSPTDEKSQLKPTRVGGNSGKDMAANVKTQYIGMISLISSGLTPHRGSFAGLAWAEQARFVPDGIGEILYPQGIRYCGFWQCGQRHGFGVEYDPNKSTVYMGGFVYDQREGSGTLHYCTTGVIFSGSWKKGNLTETSNAILPTSPFILQGGLWKSYENWSFEHGALMRSSVPLSGIWEPLFLAFDEKLASAPWDHQGTSPTTKTATSTTMEGLDNDEKDHADEKNILLLSNMMQSSEFKALLVPFQRCYYFLYKPCVGRGRRNCNGSSSLEEDAGHSLTQWAFSSFSSPAAARSAPVSRSSLLTAYDDENRPLSNSHDILRSRWASLRCFQQEKLDMKSLERLSPLVLQLRELGSDYRQGFGEAPGGGCWSCPSWCEEMGVVGGNGDNSKSISSNISNGIGSGAIRCFHTESVVESLAKRMSPVKLFERAMRDLASFVSSVRLRLLSYVAAHPLACDVSVSKRVLAVCWDSVYALVAPVIHELAAAAEAEAVIATSLALQRCTSLGPHDFIPMAFAKNFDYFEEDRKVTKWLARLFSSPTHHSRRVVEQTINGQLLCFSPHVGSGQETPAVYFSPACMFAAFDSVYKISLRLFPQHPLLQERWMSYSVLEAFNYAKGIVPRDALSPPAVLRILHFLAAEVNPRYPFPGGSTELRDDAITSKGWEKALHVTNGNSTNRKDGRDLSAIMESDTVDLESWLNSFTALYSAPKEATEVVSLLDFFRDGVDRLQSVYPSVRVNSLRPSAMDVTVLEGGVLGIVYPLDELAVRTRFVLLAASEWLRNRQQQGGKECEWNINDGKEVEMTTDGENGDTSRKANGLIQRVLSLPISVMQPALSQQADELSYETIHLHEDGLMHSVEQRRQQEMSSIANLSSEVLLWIVECIGRVLESPNFPSAVTNSMAPRRTSMQPRETQQLRQPDPLPFNLGNKERCDFPAEFTVATPKESSWGGAVSDQDEGNVVGSQYLRYQWKHFIPNNMTFQNCSASLPLGDTNESHADTDASAAATTSELLTEAESLQISLLQSFLAEVGLWITLDMHSCYDNEEDVSSASLAPYAISPREEKTVRRCVGKEAILSLQVGLSFLGSRAWEVLADAWLAACLRLRANASAFPHARRKCNPIDALKCVH